METIDLAVILLILWAVFTGWRRGLLKELVSMCGFFVGLLAAYLIYITFGDELAPSVSSDGVSGHFFGSIAVFVITWVVVPIVLGVAANVVTRSFKSLLFGKMNAFGGAVVCAVKYLILMSFVFSAMDFLGIMNREKSQASWFYGPISHLAGEVFSGKARPKSQSAQRNSSDTVWVEVKHPPKSHKIQK